MKFPYFFPTPLSFGFVIIIQITICHLFSTADKSEGQESATSNEKIKRDLKELILVKVDGDGDGKVSFEELKKYLTKLHDQNMEFNVDRQWIVYSPQIHEVFSWDGYEPEKKEVLTWDHYFNQTYPELVGIEVPGVPIVREQDTSRILNKPTDESSGSPLKKDSGSEKGSLEDSQHLKALKMMAQRADARWKLADENGDTLLTKDEFKFLLHPDEGNEELQKLFVNEATQDMDLNKDAKIDLQEFMTHLEILASEQERADEKWLSSQRENFARLLDKDKDGSLDQSEIRSWLVPSKGKKFEDEATRYLNIGDKDDDSTLSQLEVLQQFEQFVSLLPSEYWQRTSLEDESGQNETSEQLSARQEL